MTVHWVGTGRAAAPGLRRLVIAGHELVAWSRNLDAAEDAVGDLTQRLREFDRAALAEEVQEGDVVVSMMPAAWHADLAGLAVRRGAHFAAPCALTPSLRALHAEAQIRGVRVVLESGFAPGIDHLFAHRLVADWRAAAAFDPDAVLDFASFSGLQPAGAPAASAIGPVRLRRDFTDRTIPCPEAARWRVTVPLPTPEAFDAVPTGDAVALTEAYSIDPTWRLRSAVRGALALDPIQRDERAVLSVSLAATGPDGPVWRGSAVLEARGGGRDGARARLVSVPVSLAAGAALARRVPAGVSIAPSAPDLLNAWLAEIAPLADHFAIATSDK